MKKLLLSFLLLVCNLGYSTSQLDSLYPVRITLFTQFMSEKYFFGHIEAEILELNNLPQSIKTQYNFNKDQKNNGDYYYINYWPSGNKKPEINPFEEYNGVKVILIYLNESQLIFFIDNANKIAQQISGLKFGDHRKGYNIIRNNCADALSKALGLDPKSYKLFGITFPEYVCKGIIKNFSEYDATNKVSLISISK